VRLLGPTDSPVGRDFQSSILVCKSIKYVVETGQYFTVFCSDDREPTRPPHRNLAHTPPAEPSKDTGPTHPAPHHCPQLSAPLPRSILNSSSLLPRPHHRLEVPPLSPTNAKRSTPAPVVDAAARTSDPRPCATLPTKPQPTKQQLPASEYPLRFPAAAICSPRPPAGTTRRSSRGWRQGFFVPLCPRSLSRPDPRPAQRCHPTPDLFPTELAGQCLPAESPVAHILTNSKG
jgi:hypothetical protein